MCLIILGLQQHPRYPLVVVANRDEFYDRPSAPMAFWDQEPGILAGRDLQSGGTWLGITRAGRLAMVTNFREKGRFDASAPSRGELVQQFLAATVPGDDFLDDLQSHADRYNGFNLLVGTVSELHYLSNRGGGRSILTSGMFGLSNHFLDTPWPKVAKARGALRRRLARPSLTSASLLDLLSDRTVAPDDVLPQTGLGSELERMLSPMFIRSPRYGTRVTTAIVVDDARNVFISERTYHADENRPIDRHFEFSIGVDDV